ncbi:hypothetical protein TrVE_jg2344 [Triparma verrucosa]|uniref:Uncharacterized protein n=1 Tax=Triparma verrucosa TaxID=1606542 RepID=A0A9W7KTF2_9STRA|nr:hypothetical protein TrVE_jg2344 [Triparma verrucosa]
MATISPTPVNGTEEGTEGVEMVAPAPIDPRAPTENAGISPNPSVDEPNPDLPPSQDPLPEQVVGSPDVENPAAADVSKPATMERRGTVHDLNHNWTLSEVEKSKFCGSGVYAAWNMKKLNACVLDVVLFQWLKKGRKLIIEGKKIDTVTFEDPENIRRFQFTFKEMGTYTVTCTDGTDIFKTKVYVSNAEAHLRNTVIRNVLAFGLLGGILILGSKVVTDVGFSSAGLVPDNNNPNYEASGQEEMAIIMKNHSSVTIILATVIIVIAPLYALLMFFKPTPLTAYGRGFDYTVHSSVRSVLGLTSLILFSIVLWGWGSYGENGNAIEHIMHEVGYIAIFVGEQLGSAAGSLGVAINGTKIINEKYAQSFYKNVDCPYSNVDMCYPNAENWEGSLSRTSIRSNFPFRYGGAPEQLMGDVNYCPCSTPFDTSKGCVFCQLQLGIFYQLAHALAGYEEEGLVFSDNAEMEEMLATANAESENAESYGEIGEQLMATIMRIRMLLIYFLMQIALISSACCAAGAWRSKQRLIRAGGWCALVALVIALFSYSINKPLAVVVEKSVDTMVAANNDLSSVNNTEMPLMQILAYCKASDEDATDDSSNSFDLAFVADLASMINPNATTTSTSPAAVKDSIRLASATMVGLQTYFLSSPDLTMALGNGVEMLPIINGIFAAVGNIISIIDCEVVYQVFERILVILQEEGVPSFNKIADAEITLCFFLGIIFCISRFTAYVLDRPRKLWYCAETKRWFRFKAAYNAHMSLLKKHKAQSSINRAASAVAEFAKSSARAVIPSFSCIGIAMEIAMTFHIFLFMLIPNAFMALSGSGFRGVKSYVPSMLLATAVIGLSATWSVGKGKCAAGGAIFAVILAFLSALSCVAGAAENLIDVLDCLNIMNDAYETTNEAKENGEEVSYAQALTEAQESKPGLSCDFGSISDYAQGMIFCFVCFILTLLCFLSGICFLCARNHLVTDSVRKTMLKVSKSSTADGATNDLIEKLGGERTDGLGSSGIEKLQIKFKRFKGDWKFKYFMFVVCGAGAAVAGLIIKTATDLGAEPIPEWNFNQCSGKAQCCNGLDSNCAKRINEVTFAGIHNSMSNAEDGWLSPNNFLPHLGGLEAGYRALMVDVFMFDGDFDDSTPETLYVCHGLCAFGRRTALDDFNVTKVWLDENPNEVIIMYIENQPNTNDAMWDTMEELGMNDMLVVRDSDGEWPTLGDCVDNNKRIVFMKQEGDCLAGSGPKCPPGFLDGFEESFDTPYAIMDPMDYYSDKENLIFDNAILDRGTFDEKNLFVLEHFITNPVASPTSAHALNWNPFLFDRVKALEADFGMRINFISIDFWSIGDAVYVAQENNKLPIPEKTGTGGTNIVPEG